jgi:hypothetical protein
MKIREKGGWVMRFKEEKNGWTSELLTRKMRKGKGGKQRDKKT